MNIILESEIKRIREEKDSGDLTVNELLEYCIRLYNIVYEEENKCDYQNMSDELLSNLQRIYDTYKSIDDSKFSKSYTYFIDTYNTLEPMEQYDVLIQLNKLLKLELNKLFNLINSIYEYFIAPIPLSFLVEKFDDEYNSYLTQIVKHNTNYPISSLKNNIDFQLTLPIRPIPINKQIALTKLKQSLLLSVSQKNKQLKEYNEQLCVFLSPPTSDEYKSVIDYYMCDISELKREIDKEETLLSGINSILNKVPEGIVFRNEEELLRMEKTYETYKKNIKRILTKEEYWIFKDFYTVYTL